MKKSEISKQMAEEISKRFELPQDKITPNLNFIKDLDADSIDFVELIMEIEDKYNIEIPDEDANKLDTFQSAVNYIYNQITQKTN